MAKHHRIFIAFAIEDEWARINLGGQAKNERSTFEFTDMSVKKPWDEEWKKNCRSRIRGCDGTIAMISKNTAKADGQLWEIKTSLEEGIPVLAIYTTQDDRPSTLPSQLSKLSVKPWTWSNISSFINSL